MQQGSEKKRRTKTLLQHTSFKPFRRISRFVLSVLLSKWPLPPAPTECSLHGCASLATPCRRVWSTPWTLLISRATVLLLIGHN